MNNRMIASAPGCLISRHSRSTRKRFPNRWRASSLASSGDIPASRLSWILISRCERSSIVISRRSARRARNADKRGNPSLQCNIRQLPLFGGLHHHGNQRRSALPARRLSVELLAPQSRELVKLGLSISLGHTPFSRQPSALFHAVKCWIQRPFFDPQSIVSGLLKPSSDCIAVKRPARQGLEDHHIQSSLKQVCYSHLFLTTIPIIPRRPKHSKLYLGRQGIRYSAAPARHWFKRVVIEFDGIAQCDRVHTRYGRKSYRAAVAAVSSGSIGSAVPTTLRS